MLRLRRHVFGDRRGRFGEDGLGQGPRPRAGRRRIHRVGRHVVPDASARLRRTHRRADEVHPHRPDLERSPRMSTHRGDGAARLHRELRAEDDHDAIVRDGRRLDHAKAASKPLRVAPEPQPRGARVHGNRRIDHAKAAGASSKSGARRVSRQTPLGPAQQTRRRRTACPNGRRCASWRRGSRSTRSRISPTTSNSS